MSTLTLEEQASPSTPSANQVVVYPKADGLLYSKDDVGTERLLNAVLNKGIYGLTYANAAGDVVNDIDIAAGGCMDSTGAYWITLVAITKQLDAAWAVGTNQGGLDTGSIGNSDYYIWAIARSDTGVTDALFSLSSTAPTMPTSYSFKRLIGWFKRVGATIVLFNTYETAGGGLELRWTSPTLDVDLSNTLTTSARTDAIKVPADITITGHITAQAADVTANCLVLISSTDQTDVAPSGTAAPLTTLRPLATDGANGKLLPVDVITTNATIRARADLATVDTYRVVTLGFTWARRN